MSKHLREDLIKLRKGMYVSKHDPDFHEKYLRYFPDDEKIQYDYANILLRRGEKEKARHHLERAAALGNRSAKQQLSTIPQDGEPVVEEVEGGRTVPIERKVVPHRHDAILYPLLFFCILLLLFLLFWIFSHHLQTYTYEKNRYEENTYRENVYEQHIYEKKGGEEEREGEKEEKLDIGASVVIHAAERFFLEKGQYPTHEELLGAYPNNYLSALPPGVTYSGTPTGYEVRWGMQGEREKEEEKGVAEALSLHFYRESNELALVRGEEVVVVYSVASGVSQVPPNPTNVTGRVVLPNGGGGAYGTRGLVLEDDFAIHGTNEPEKIGEYVSHGCIRMHNADIEELYPLVSIGTPLHVIQEGAAPPPSHDNLLELGPPVIEEREMAPDVLFAWKK